jgi:hypothetical protein
MQVGEALAQDGAGGDWIGHDAQQIVTREIYYWLKIKGALPCKVHPEQAISAVHSLSILIKKTNPVKSFTACSVSVCISMATIDQQIV